MHIHVYSGPTDHMSRFYKMETCLNFYTRKANRVLNKIYDGHLQVCGLKGGQFTILRVIDKFKQTTNRELQDALLIDQTTLSRSLKPLIRDGFIEVRQGEDLRVKLLSLPPKGKKLLNEATSYWQDAQNEVKRRLGKKSSEQLLAITNHVAELGA